MELEAVAAAAGTIITICIKLNCPLPSLPSAQHSHSLSREVREDDNGPGNVPPLPPHYTL